MFRAETADKNNSRIVGAGATLPHTNVTRSSASASHRSAGTLAIREAMEAAEGADWPMARFSMGSKPI
jgi:hypothetical protein